MQTHQLIGDPKEILRSHSYRLFYDFLIESEGLTNELYAKGLIPLEVKGSILTTEKTHHHMSSQLVCDLQMFLESSIDPVQFLYKFCGVLLSDGIETRRRQRLAKSMLNQLSKCIKLIVLCEHF